MNFTIETASKKQAKLRIGIAGPSGAGKTYSSLQVAYGLTDNWEKIVVIDTEQGSANFYADLGGFKVLNLTPPYSPERYIGAIEACENMGFEVIIIDSLSHAWIGRGGLLEEHELLGVRDSYFKMTKPRHRKIIDRILASTSNVIVTVRSKSTLQVTQDGDKTKVQKMGLNAITESEFDYEMSAYFEVSINHMAEATKDRTKIFMRPKEITVPVLLTPEIGRTMKAWAESGTPATPIAQAPKIETPKPEAVQKTMPMPAQEPQAEQTGFIEELEAEKSKTEKQIDEALGESTPEEKPLADHYCTKHKTEFKEHNKNGKSWYSHPYKDETGTTKWCNEKVKYSDKTLQAIEDTRTKLYSNA